MIPKIPDPPNLSKVGNITILPYIEKVFERIVTRRLLPQLKFSRRQFGFQHSTSCDHCLPLMRDKILRIIDKGEKFAAVLALDLVSAFPSINHQAIIDGLVRMNVEPRLISLSGNVTEG